MEVYQSGGVDSGTINGRYILIEPFWFIFLQLQITICDPINDNGKAFFGSCQGCPVLSINDLFCMRPFIGLVFKLSMGSLGTCHWFWFSVDLIADRWSSVDLITALLLWFMVCRRLPELNVPGLYFFSFCTSSSSEIPTPSKTCTKAEFWKCASSPLGSGARLKAILWCTFHIKPNRELRSSPLERASKLLINLHAIWGLVY